MRKDVKSREFKLIRNRCTGIFRSRAGLGYLLHEAADPAPGLGDHEQRDFY
jgi:hypothetical protein